MPRQERALVSLAHSFWLNRAIDGMAEKTRSPTTEPHIYSCKKYYSSLPRNRNSLNQQIGFFLHHVLSMRHFFCFFSHFIQAFPFLSSSICSNAVIVLPYKFQNRCLCAWSFSVHLLYFIIRLFLSHTHTHAPGFSLSLPVFFVIILFHSNIIKIYL